MQLRLEEVVLSQLKKYRKKFKLDKLCIAGGVGLNCSLNGKILKEGIFKEIFVQPASGDSGLVLGALYLAISNNCKKKKLQIKKRYDHYLGSIFSNKEEEYYLKKKQNNLSKTSKCI